MDSHWFCSPYLRTTALEDNAEGHFQSVPSTPANVPLVLAALFLKAVFRCSDMPPSTNQRIDLYFTMDETMMAVKRKGPLHQQQGSLWMKTCLCWLSWLWWFKGCESCANKPAIGLCHATISQWTQKPWSVRIKQTNALQTALVTV